MEVRECSVPQSAHSNAVGAVIESDMVEMAAVVVGTGAHCMVAVAVGWQAQHELVPPVRGEQSYGGIPLALVQ